MQIDFANVWCQRDDLQYLPASAEILDMQDVVREALKI